MILALLVFSVGVLTGGIKMSLTRVNRLCAQCIKECKQWAQVKVIRCPFFKSKQHGSLKPKDGHTLAPEQNRLEDHREAIIES